MNTKNKTIISVYGSLLAGLGNHGVISQYIRTGEAKFIADDKIKGFDLYAVSSFPGIKRSADTNKLVNVEVYEVEDRALASVRMLEGYREGGSNTFYDEIDVETENNGTVRAYLYMPDVYPQDLVEDGNWMKYKMRGDVL